MCGTPSPLELLTVLRTTFYNKWLSEGDNVTYTDFIHKAFDNLVLPGSTSITKFSFMKGINLIVPTLNNQDSANIFALLDEDKSNKIEFPEVLKGMTTPMNAKRTAAVKAMFDEADTDHSGTITVQDFISTHKGVYRGEYFITHVLGAYNKDMTITYTDFVNYYTDHSMAYEDDEAFVEFLKKVWVKPVSYTDILFDNLKTALISKWKSNGPDDAAVVTKEDYLIFQYKLSRELFKNNKKSVTLFDFMDKLNDQFKSLINERLHINDKKASYISFVRKVFSSKLDIDKGEFITKDEFVNYVYDLNIKFSERDVTRIFSLFNNYERGIKFADLVDQLHVKLSVVRYNVVREVFDKLDVDLSGTLTISDVIKKNISVLTEYCHDMNVIKYTEFINYYKDLSVTIDNDEDFAVAVRKAWL